MVKSKKFHLQFFAFTLFLLSWHPIRPVRGQGVEEIEYDNRQGSLFGAVEEIEYDNRQGSLFGAVEEIEYDNRQGSLFGAVEVMEYDYREGSPKGPEHWGELNKELEQCKDGKLQSPIDLFYSNARKAISRVDDLNMSYKPSKATMKHEHHAISIQWEGDAGSIQINGTDYLLKRCHWHRSSEHFINGRSYDLELHMVHQSQNNDVAVVAFLYQSGNPDPFLSKISNDVSSLSVTKEARLGVINPSLIKWPSSRFYRYIGSLTAPPCTEGVIWSVSEEVRSVSKQQLGLIEQVDRGMNARPLQPLNNRDITLFGPQ